MAEQGVWEYVEGVRVGVTLLILGGQQGMAERGEHVGNRDGVLVAVPGRAGAVGGKVAGGLAVETAVG